MKTKHLRHRCKSCAFCLLVLVCAFPASAAEHLGIYQHGMIVRMHMDDCMSAPHGFLATMSGIQPQMIAEPCPEYTLVSDKVVYVIVGKSSKQLIPLADVIDFRFQGGVLVVRLDDARHETKFTIKEMILRTEWDRMQLHIEEQLKTADVHEPAR